MLYFLSFIGLINCINSMLQTSNILLYHLLFTPSWCEWSWLRRGLLAFLLWVSYPVSDTPAMVCSCGSSHLDGR